MRLFVSSLGCAAAQGLVQAVQGPGVTVVGGDMRAEHGGRDLVEHHVQLPSGRDPSFPAAVRAVLVEHDIDLYVPVMEPELRAAVRHGAALSRRPGDILVSAERAIETARSKARLSLAFDAAGLETPEIIPLSSPRFPLFVRPDDGTGSRGAGPARDADELARALATIPGAVALTELVEGPEFSIDGFADREHRVRHALCRSRDEVRGGLAVQSCVVPMPSELADPIAALARDLGLVGFFNLQFRQRGEQRLFFDLNPRLGGAMALSFGAGLDARGMLAALLSRGPWPEPTTRVGARLHRRWHNRVQLPPS